jgi:predicted nuclease of restriction endonuclease-like (RecB) superfamily
LISGVRVAKKALSIGKDYAVWLKSVKDKIRSVQLKAAVSVNVALLEFYWELGAEIVSKQKDAVWGEGFLSRLSADLTSEFPEMKGFSERNLRAVRQWYLFYAAADACAGKEVVSIRQQAVAELPDQAIFQIPWGHNLVIIAQIDTVKDALFYVRKTIENGWSRNVLTHQIESGLHKRASKAVTNFKTTLPSVQSDLAAQTLKDPYCFDFLQLREKHDEKELEDALVAHVTKFLLELGAGFSFIGRQYRLEIDGDEFFADLLFYHTKLHCYVVVELKTGKFKPEYAGKLNFYVSAIDGIVKTERDNPTVGLLICKTKKDTVVEYALKDVHKPIGVSGYELTKHLPAEFTSSLPSIETIEAEISDECAKRTKVNKPKGTR